MNNASGSLGKVTSLNPADITTGLPTCRKLPCEVLRETGTTETVVESNSNTKDGKTTTRTTEKEKVGPLAFLIPGNHDWYDNLDTYQELIMNKSWLGGWYMPQEQPYFAVHLTKNWYVFGIDTGLTDDIDVIQFQYF